MKILKRFGLTIPQGKIFSSTRTNTEAIASGIVEVRGLSVNLGSRKILSDLNLTFAPGQIHFILGLNGSGKTTLLRSFMQVLPYHGTIGLGDVNLATLPPKAVARHIAWVPQSRNSYQHITVWDFVLLGRYPYLNWLGNYGQHDRQIAQKHIRTLNLEPLASRHLGQLSGGELQKVGLAQALAQETNVILLDEPAQALDPLARQELWKLLFELADEGKTLICTSHHLDAISSPLSRTIGLKDGQVVYDQISPQDQSTVIEVVYGKATSKKNP